jgi:hypothetical protein
VVLSLKELLLLLSPVFGFKLCLTADLPQFCITIDLAAKMMDL